MSGESVPMSLDQIPLEPPPQEKHVNWGQAEIREHGRFLDEENKLHLADEVLGTQMRRAISYEQEGHVERGNVRGKPRAIPAHERASLVKETASIGRNMLARLESPPVGEEDKVRFPVMYAWVVRSDGRIDYRETPDSPHLITSRPIVKEKARLVQCDDGQQFVLHDPAREVQSALRAYGVPYNQDRPLASKSRHYLTRAGQVGRARAHRDVILNAIRRIEQEFEIRPNKPHRCHNYIEECKTALDRLFVVKMLG